MDLALCRSHALLQGIPDADWKPLLDRCTVQSLAQGEILLERGGENHRLYFLLAGRLEVQMSATDAVDRLIILPGELVGEMSIIEGRAVMADVIAGEPSTVLAMPEEVFWRDYCTQSTVIPGLLRSFVQRVRKTDAVLREEFEHHLRYEMMQKELTSAARIQANILPPAQLSAHATLDVHSLFKPARVVGGDFYDAVTLGSNRLAIAVGDVSGKGMPAALFMVRVMTLLRLILLREPEAHTILPELNRQLCMGNDECMFVTLAILLLDPETGRAIYLNAGHLPPLVAVPGQPFELWDPPLGPMLGLSPEGLFELRERMLQPGETVVLCTDGITEAENEQQELFGLASTALALARPDRPFTPESLVGSLDQAVTTFAGNAPQSDDITVLAVTYRGASSLSSNPPRSVS